MAKPSLDMTINIVIAYLINTAGSRQKNKTEGKQNKRTNKKITNEEKEKNATYSKKKRSIVDLSCNGNADNNRKKNGGRIQIKDNKKSIEYYR